MIRFGTGGFRAIIGDEFTKANIQILSQAMVNKMKAEGVQDKGIVMGYDRRFLSKEAMRWSAEVFAASGIKASLINKSCPTPLVMFYVMKHSLPYGIMITASHNPAVYNGVKVFTKGGRDADEQQTADIERYIGEVKEPVNSLEYADAVEKGLIEEIYPINDYLDSILSEIDQKAIRDARLRVALDPLYGVSETSIKTILITARCEVETIHGQHDTLFGGKLPAPNKERMRALSNTVLEYGFDIGIATDGDADRIGVVDDKGRYLTPNDILVLLYYYLVKYKGKKGPVVKNLCTTAMLDRLAEKFGEKCYEVPVGFKHISAKMNEVDALIGGESSGGLTVKGHIKGKDGIYAASLLVEMLAVTGKKMSRIYDDIREEVGGLCMVENNYTFRHAQKEEFQKLLMEDKKLPDLPFEIDRVSYLDGSKVIFKNGGWVSARFSGTEPLLRVFCEMKEESDAQMVCEIYREFLGLPKQKY
ncbi:MAG: phosphoglucomutase/phosphomannomutase family protein [Lachnospiraceae bacterium]|nr:phosphoglucomutase/phosphomannomutase family protein [Lachnospiraceae bacterium]